MPPSRLTLGPAPGTRLPTAAPSEPRAVSLNRLAAGGRWRVEAMRSYGQPLLLWFTRGQGRITVAGASRGYGPHHAVFLPAGTMHGFAMLGQVFGTALFLPVEDGHDWPDEPLHIRLREARRQAELTGLIETLERELLGDALARDRALHHHIGLLSVWLARNADLPDPLGQTPPGPTASDRLAAAYSALVERDFRDPKSVAAYAAELGVSPTHLSRACRNAGGRAALAILIDRKLYEARRLLTETRRPVKEIAASLGFASPAYFTRAFRAKTGQSPSEFRRDF